MPSRSHDLEFHVSFAGSTDTQIFHNFDKAAGMALAKACSGRDVHIDVVTWTRAAAKRWAGEYGLEVYDSDPEASVHDRILIKAESLGHVA
jgi:imidazole glycerol phosphate synthase subunit HisF